MQEITKEFLDELLATQKKLKEMYEALENRISHVNIWEEEKIGSKHYREDWVRGQITNVEVTDSEIEIESFGFDDFYERYRESQVYFPLDKLLSDDWKEAALKEYQKKQNALRKKKEQEEQKKVLEKERRERAEYERLKAKFEGLEEEAYERV